MPDKLFIVPYDVTWPNQFISLAKLLRETLGGVALRIDHIGSTAVPNLAAKDIVDIQISVASFDPIAHIQQPMERLGYVFRANNDDLTKRYFREAPDTKRTHIHVRKIGSWSQQFALLFRDYLREHPDDADQYAQLKIRLAAELADRRQDYVDAKSPLIWEIMQKASRWSQRIGWEPGPSDY
ncbi:MAG: GrpB family protein [Chloroflexota bacterium]